LPFEGVQTSDIPFHLTEEDINFAAFLRLSTKKQYVARGQSGNKNRRDKHGRQLQFLWAFHENHCRSRSLRSERIHPPISRGVLIRQVGNLLDFTAIWDGQVKY